MRDARSDNVLSHFRVVKYNGNNSYQCTCPSHDDKKASLTVSFTGDKILLHCHAGCKTEDILSGAELKAADLFLNDLPQRASWISYVEKCVSEQMKRTFRYVEHYDYENRDSEYVYTKVRLEDRKGEKEIRYGYLENKRLHLSLKRKTGKSAKELKGLYGGVRDVKAAIEKGDPVFYCEGEKDVNTMKSHGYVAITAGGSDDWQKAHAEHFRDANLIILQDNDQSGEKLTSAIYHDVKDIVKSIRVIVPTPDIPKGDISDYFADHTKKNFETLVFNASLPERLIESPNLFEFHLVNKEGVPSGVFDWNIFEYIRKKIPMFIIGEVPYIYDKGVYSADESGTKLKTIIRDLMFPEFRKSGTIERVYKLFLSDDELYTQYDEINLHPRHWVNFQNGFYDPKDKKLLLHDSDYKSINQLAIRYDPDHVEQNAIMDEWLHFIAPEDDDLEMLLQFIGYCFTSDTSMQKLLILNGGGGTGKSTLIRIIETMVGYSNISNISLTQLASERFAPYGLMGKTLNTCADLEIAALEDTSMLKKALGEDSLRAEKKGKDSFSFKSYAKMVFSTNQLPTIRAERTNGLYRRLLIHTMNKVPENKQADFYDRLQDGIPWLVQLAVEALGRMYMQGNITESQASMKAVNELRKDSDPIEAWLQDMTIKKRDSAEKRTMLFSSYSKYCDDAEITGKCNARSFAKALRQKGYEAFHRNDGDYIRDISLLNSITKTAGEVSPDIAEDDLPWNFD